MLLFFKIEVQKTKGEKQTKPPDKQKAPPHTKKHKTIHGLKKFFSLSTLW
jgi:hypothetical protein